MERKPETANELSRQPFQTLNTGETVKGVVREITERGVEVEVYGGAKQAAYIKFSEWSDDPKDNVHVGDEIEAYVLRVNDVEGFAELSKRRLNAWKKREAAAKEPSAPEMREPTEALLDAVRKKERELAEREAALAIGENALAAQKEAWENSCRAYRERIEETLHEQFEQERTTLQAQVKRERDAIQEQSGERLKALETELQQKRAGAERQLARDMETARREAKEALDKEISGEREKERVRVQEDLERERAERIKTMELDFAQMRKEREEAWDALRQTQQGIISAGQEDLNRRRAELDTCQEELERRQEELNQREQSLRAREHDALTQEENIAFKKECLNARGALLDEREERIENDVRQQLEDERRSVNAERDNAREEADRLRGRLRDAQKELDSYREVNEVWDGNPARLLGELETLRNDNQRLRDDLASRPPKTLETDYDQLKKTKDELEARCRAMQEEQGRVERDNARLNQLELENSRMTEQVKVLEFDAEEYKARCEKYRVQLERYRSPEQAAQGREERIQEIRQPYLTSFPIPVDETGNKLAQPENEIVWLDDIGRKSAAYGIAFPKRILYAFHTALKIADWSSITVLAGVSGTGKSELPRLYSAFGGINFISVPVQPNWDSQESMLGYFNSIDNRFDAQPLLRFLVQCTNNAPNVEGAEGKKIANPLEYPYPLGRFMGIVLLDEMNLAHVEHYFADFLSKLELRRGKARDDEPEIEVKLGAGYAPFPLKLKRNILWVGTMNEDETTKSLSDKVLDRGIMIHFPRPKNLNSRVSMGILSDMSNKVLLLYKTWDKWCRRKTTFSGAVRAEVDRYKHLVEAINNELEKSGRAVGHRVWQSIEYYLENYPTVISNRPTAADDAAPEDEELTPALREALETAFEDQLVQKVMPKLRGIETRGEGGKQLDEIKRLLEEEGFERILPDFDNACNYGYGQFVWNSAHYLEESQNAPLD